MRNALWGLYKALQAEAEWHQEVYRQVFPPLRGETANLVCLD